MIIVDKALESRAIEGRPVRVGLIGAGYMGLGMSRQIIEKMPGMDVVAIANRTVGTAADVFA
ncbi:MAG: NAD(P)-dependent oxidoreductase, partial [Acidimicrobiia bacterium]